MSETKDVKRAFQGTVEARVSKTCYNQEGYCLHWVHDQVDDNPRLQFGYLIESSDPHFQGPIMGKGTVKGCGNPWNTVSESYAKIVRASKPKPIYSPAGQRPVVNIKMVPYSELITCLKRELSGSCDVVYVRDAVTHKVVYVHYNAKVDDKKKIEQAYVIRTVLIHDPSPMIQNLADGTQELCLSFGGHTFLDVYYRKSSSDMCLKVEAFCMSEPPTKKLHAL